jgi:hypothetical protein
MFNSLRERLGTQIRLTEGGGPYPPISQKSPSSRGRRSQFGISEAPEAISSLPVDASRQTGPWNEARGQRSKLRSKLH